ncbi:efflux RND transporter permease subunit [Geobacillus proteiniphilus]|uniref:Efflux RND transporter permease subunit n=1 Tax=Geobacillus proteiniphilus TaxID=860353 RepID=A0ABY9MHA9_9BACL|nr:efflux RND transporter permease subunit [Geobacillus proteiniphilus]WMJ17055.1 efflux RND transporter permease subunit [Geobacillus proteiniphilus]
MTFLTRFSLKNAAAVFVCSFLLLLLGLYSFSSLKVDLLPNIEFPQLSIEAVYPGASPQDMNEEVTTKLEEKLKSLDGLKQMQSSSYEGMAVINLEFPFRTDMEKMERQVESLIDKAGLPDNVQTEVNRFSFGSIPIFNISLFAKNGTDLQTLLETEVIPELNKIDGVNSVSIGGDSERLIRITVDRKKAAQAGLTLSEIKNQINEKVLVFPAGTLRTDTWQIPVRVEEKLSTIHELKNLKLVPTAVPMAANGLQRVAPVKLGDIATIEEVNEQSEFTRYNLKPSLSMAVTKKQDANTIEVADQVIKVLNSYKNQFDYSIGFDSSAGIKQSVESLVREGLLGALFASLAVLLFLRNVRATVIAIVSIPLSLLVSAIFLNRMDITLNVMTLGGMAVAVGRVVDDSIVVIENIFRRVRREKTGMSDDLVEQSTKEIVKAIVSSTITTVVVFLPLGLVGGITGEFFLPFALTITFALLASLLVAVTLVPILAKFSFRRVPPEEKEGALQRLYGRIIEWALNHKAIVFVLSVVLLVGSLALVPKLGFTFLPNEEQKTLVASIELPASTSVAKTNDVSLEMEKMFLKRSDVKSVTAAVGSRDFRTGLKRPNQASYYILLKDSADTAKTVAVFEKEMRRIANQLAPGAKVGVQEMSSGGPPTNNNVNIDLYSNDLEALQTAAKQVEMYLKQRDDVKDVTNNLTEKQKQVIVAIDPEKAATYGVSGMQLLGAVADATKPVDVGTLKLGGKDEQVELSYDKTLGSIDELKELPIVTRNGVIPLSAVAEVKEAQVYTSIQKLDGKVFARVSAQIVGDNIQKVTNDVTKHVNDLKLPSDVTVKTGGGSDETVQTFRELGVAMAAAIGLVYLTMLITFGKVRVPLIILSSLLFVPIGSLFALYVTDEPLSISVMIGLLMLIGIVTTNAIVLVDRIGQNREQKRMTVRSAIIEAGKTRLRPILMTAFATVTALIPLALTNEAGTLISKGLAITVIGGLTSSTLLTLVFIPAMYEAFFFRTAKGEPMAK